MCLLMDRQTTAAAMGDVSTHFLPFNGTSPATAQRPCFASRARCQGTTECPSGAAHGGFVIGPGSMSRNWVLPLPCLSPTVASAFIPMAAIRAAET